MSDFSPEQVDAMVVRIITLIDVMIETIHEENTVLAGGVPASLTQTLARKASLATELEQWTTAVRSRKLRLEYADPELRDWMRRRGANLQAAMNENVLRLQAAMQATRRRVDSVMRAMREQLAEHGGYHANGRAAAAKPSLSVTAGRLA